MDFTIITMLPTRSTHQTRIANDVSSQAAPDPTTMVKTSRNANAVKSPRSPLFGTTLTLPEYIH
jgi:hypothetical protein